MAKPLRGPTRRAVAVLPPALKVSFLTDAATLVSDACPRLANYLARRALEVVPAAGIRQMRWLPLELYSTTGWA